MKIGVMGALPEEIDSVRALLDAPRTVTLGGRVFVQGDAFGHGLVIAGSGIGKVAAAVTATELVVRFGVTRILFTGVAGALNPDIAIGDLVVAEWLSHHDLDASPLFPPMEIPLTGVSRIPTDRPLTARLTRAGETYCASQRCPEVSAMSPRRPARLWTGGIVSGDQFVSGPVQRDAIRRLVPDALCVEMEGAAVAQVCLDYGVPFGVVRLISDAADEGAAADFSASIGRLAGECALTIIDSVFRAD